MELRLYDTLTKEKRVFTPLDPNHVRMYVCGPTVYDFAHIGNARPVIVFDVLFRLLRHLYGESHVIYVRNITDVDDKINDRAARDFPGLPLNEAIRKVTEQTEKQFHDDVDALGCLRPTVEPRATEHIAEMRTIIERLVQGGFAYVAEDHVLFSPQAMNAANSVLPRYGALANRSLDEMIAGARVDVAPYKRDATDFVLWKPSKPGEPSWPSPSGIKPEGRPGWHIECSAMAWKHLGEQFDIHGGGIDLVFPHHENELAQSCCAFHENRMANVWMHNGFLQVEGEKMSKSLGNFVTIRELLADWPGEVIRHAMLQTHYRQPIDFTLNRMTAAADQLEKISNLLLIRSGGPIAQSALRHYDWLGSIPTISEALVDHLSDDLNTPAAINDILARVNQKRHHFDDIEQIASDCLFLGVLNSEFPLLFASSVIQRKNQRGELVIGEDNLEILSLPLIRKLVASKDESKLNSYLTEMRENGLEIAIEHGGIRISPASEANANPRYAEVDILVSRRAAARARKDFKESDRIRDELAAMGVVLKDGKDTDGNPVTTWEIAR